jgi:sugar phosphate isomerase/epimerase
MHNDSLRTPRREFFKQAMTAGGLLIAGGAIRNAHAADAPDWTRQAGLELFTVRDVLPKDFEGTLAKVAAMGYKEVEPATGYGDMDPKQFRATLDRYGLSMPTTHSGAAEGPDLEKTLEGFQIMGLKYTEISGPRPAGARGPGAGGPGGGAPGGGPGAGAGRAAGQGGGRGPMGGPGRGRGAAPAMTVEAAKRNAAQLNEHGKIAKKFGMKILVHNHTGEFAPLANSDLRQYDVLLAETDPELVAMQLDIGWASVAGQDILAMFQKNPGRYELWHVKDASGIKKMDGMSMSERQRSASLVPVGLGDVDYKTIFANAGVAGMKHYCVEQDNANAWGDSMAAAQVSLTNLKRILA